MLDLVRRVWRRPGEVAEMRDRWGTASQRRRGETFQGSYSGRAEMMSCCPAWRGMSMAWHCGRLLGRQVPSFMPSSLVAL
eukprot:767934-Hanusia_phi.AAC.7